MVARDHHDPDACLPASPDGLRDLRTHRIGQADEPDEREVAFDVSRRLRWIALQRPARESQHPEAVRGERIDIGGDTGSLLVRERSSTSSVEDRRADRQDGFGGSLRQHLRRSRREPMDRRHPPTSGIERELRDPRGHVLRVLALDARLPREHEQRSLRGIADRDPATVVRLEPGVVAERGRPEERFGTLAFLRVERSPAHQHGARRVVARPGYVEPPHGRDDLARRHLVGGDRARLVRTDDGRRSERLHRFQVSDERASRRHARGADRERQRERRQQPFRDERDDHPDGEQEPVARRRAEPERDPEEQQPRTHREGGDHLDRVVQLGAERCPAADDLAGQSGDAAEQRVDAGARHDDRP